MILIFIQNINIQILDTSRILSVQSYLKVSCERLFSADIPKMNFSSKASVTVPPEPEPRLRAARRGISCTWE